MSDMLGPMAVVALASALLGTGLGWLGARTEPTDVTRVTYEQLVEAGGVTRMDIYAVAPGITMRLDCVRVGDQPGMDARSGGGLSYCKWRRATDGDEREFLDTYSTGKEPPA
jgi:hypothetical protein